MYFVRNHSHAVGESKLYCCFVWVCLESIALGFAIVKLRMLCQPYKPYHTQTNRFAKPRRIDNTDMKLVEAAGYIAFTFRDGAIIVNLVGVVDAGGGCNTCGSSGFGVDGGGGDGDGGSDRDGGCGVVVIKSQKVLGFVF